MFSFIFNPIKKDGIFLLERFIFQLNHFLLECRVLVSELFFRLEMYL